MDPEAQANSERKADDADDSESPDEPARLPDVMKGESSCAEPEANDEDGVGQQDPEETSSTAKRSINSFYGHKIGAIQTLSLVLNAGLMVYAHLGLSAVIKSSLNPAQETSLLVVEGETCTNDDYSTWTSYEGEVGFPDQLDFCARTFSGGCLVNSTCTADCFEDYGYSRKCSLCFGNFPPCGLESGCFACLVDAASLDCLTCLEPCLETFYECSGLPVISSNSTENLIETIASPAGNFCHDFDLQGVEEWYTSYELTFVGSVRDSWSNGAKFLTVVIVMFSGIWPYLKCDPRNRLVHAHVSGKPDIGPAVAVATQQIYSGRRVFGHWSLSRDSIEAQDSFFLATVWEFIQIEWIKGQHDKAVLKKSEQPLVGKQLYFSRIGIPAAILVVTVGLYIAGLSTDFFSVRSVDYETSAKCVKSYNIISFGSALVNETSLEDNSAAGQTWFLCLVYFVLVLGLPVLTHVLQAVFLAGWVQSNRLLRTIEYTGMLWAFACVEILLIAALALEVNMEKLIKGLAGPSNEELVQVSSDFGPGFYILAVYSFVAGFLQFAVRVRNDGGSSK
ncbi:hypothetical protein THAOC_01599 [Thalassiosira oceanica]|uniref:Uncharacterized protein n=1 Tax=Thalassiosira oceanica TaxID=159749 RepID=K0TD74_THAOC|nr:hypothetical protein THAOC_01599 [Thalassiosira oceanica]|eukprot:EJK76628.1 hypothetical protein THAOC_01599 [Thalassiosira oceanica]